MTILRATLRLLAIHITLAFLLIKPVVASASVELVDNVDIAWTFQPAGSAEKYKLKHLGLPIIRQLPESAPCCTGVYEGVLTGKSLAEIISKSDLQFLALHLPPVYGLKTIAINNVVIFKSADGDHGSSGPIISLTKEQAEANHLLITVEIDHPRVFYSGFWQNQLMLGDYDELQSRRERLLIHQKYVPLFLTYFFLLAALLLFWLSHIKRDPDRKLSIFLEATLLWVLYYYALSGELRRFFPFWGGYLHFTLRSLADLSSIRLLLALSDRKESEIRLATLVGIFPILLGAVLSWNGEQKWQVLGFVFATIEFLLVLLFLASNRTKTVSQEPIYKFILISGVLLIIGSSMDAVKLIAIFFFHQKSTLPYISRYFDPPFILASMVYLAQRANMQAFAENRRIFLEKFSEQLLHDLRSPATVIRNVALSSKKTGDDLLENDVLAAASERIISMCRIGFSDVAVVPGSVDILILLNEIILEKNSEWRRADVVRVNHDVGPFHGLVSKNEFKRVISNILNNAYEASPENPKIEINLSATTVSIQISISDNGCGIAEDRLKEIEDGKVTSDKVSGRGIGLLNARESARQWNGTFSIRTNAGAGTTIELSVPRA